MFLRRQLPGPGKQVSLHVTLQEEAVKPVTKRDRVQCHRPLPEFPEPASEVVLHEGIQAMVRAGRQPLVLGCPEQIVQADAGVASNPPAVGKIDGIIPGAPTRRYISDIGAIQGVAQRDPVEPRRLKAGLHPPTGGADRQPGGGIDALADAAPEVAQVLPGPEVAAQVPTGGGLPQQVQADAITGKTPLPGYHFGSRLPGIMSPHAGAGCSALPAQAHLDVGQTAILAVPDAVSI